MFFKMRKIKNLIARQRMLAIVTTTLVRGTPATASSATACNATLRPNWSAGLNILTELSYSDEAKCCAACTANLSCVVFVIHGSNCFLKADADGSHAKAGNTAGFVRATPPPAPGPTPSPPLPPPSDSPRWEWVSTSTVPVIGEKHPDVVKHGIFSGFETGQFQRINDTFYYTANELGTNCDGVLWDLVTRAALWSAQNSTGPWTRLVTLRNGSHMHTLCPKDKPTLPCRVPCGGLSCCSQDAGQSFVTWAPTLLHAPSSVNESGKVLVWNLFYSSNQNSHFHDNAFMGITWAVSTTDSMLGPYVDVPGHNGTGGTLPEGGEGVVNVAVNSSHSFSAWKLRNGTWAGFRNNIPGAPSFSAGLIIPRGDPTVPGGSWKPAGPNLASGSNCSNGFCYGPENPTVTTMTMDGKYYLAVYDALEQPPLGDEQEKQETPGSSEIETALHPGVCSDATKCNRIGIGFSADGVSWKYSALVAVQTSENHPCGQIRTPLGLAPEPETCKGCYSVMWTGIAAGFRPVCRGIIRNLNEA